MELRQLRYLAAAAREASVTRAASRLHVVQPAVSQQIRKLEAELGVDLLHRIGGLRPTRVGERVIVRAERILAEVDALRDEVNAELGLLTGRIAIGSMQWLGPIDLPALLGRFHSAHPGVDIMLVEDTSAAMLDSVRREKLDLAFFSAHSLPTLTAANSVEMQVLAHEEMVVVARSDLLAEIGNPIALKDLSGRPFVGFAEGMDVRTLIGELLNKAGAKPNIVLESNELATVRDCALHGVGFAILPCGLAQTGGGLIEMRSLPPTPVYRQIALAWRSDHRLPPAAAAFRELALNTQPRVE